MGTKVLQVSRWMALAGWLATVPAHGQTRLPVFAQYPAGAPYWGKPVAPRLVPGTAAWHFRTRIREASRPPVNFAGHYVLASWGCGAECLIFALIDCKTGIVQFDTPTVCCWGTAVPHNFEPIYGRLDSRLLVLTGLLNEAGPSGTHYFAFSHGQLSPLR
ncbi:hypothetical protein [Hymenobacter bucti]|uniref:Uncharacterized protein n=1 Tax=Hymenobacter bucti TaxID=1844114 RepID=A0ABW4R007_9BACT